MDRASLVFHGGLLAHHVFIGLYTHFFVNLTDVDVPELQNIDRYRFRFLTIWNMIVQVLYLLFVLFANFGGIEDELKRTLKSIQGFLYITLIFPSGLFVFGTFWTIWSIDRELVYPVSCDEHVPSWLNHGMHTTIILLPVVDLFWRKTLPDVRNVLLALTVYFSLYQLTFFYTYYESSVWLYKVFSILSWSMRIFFVVFNYIVSVLFVIIGIFLQKQVNTNKLSIHTLNVSAIFKKLA